MNVQQIVALALLELRAGRGDSARGLLEQVRRAMPNAPSVQSAWNLVEAHQTMVSIIDRSLRDGPEFYPANSSCQVPNLGRIYEAVFGRKTNGYFVEVGAYDGRTCSNTDFLPALGWSGLYVEPVPAHLEQCIRWHGRYPGVNFENAAAGAAEGVIEITVAGVLSTANQEVARAYLEIDWAAPHFANSHVIPVRVRRLDDMLRAHGVQRHFDILVVDTEGFEGQVFQGFALEAWLPRLAIVELGDETSKVRQIESVATDTDTVKARFEAAGYNVAFADETNTIFVRQ